MRTLLVLLLAAPAFAGCVPYGVGATARPTPPYTTTVSGVVSFVPLELDTYDEPYYDEETGPGEPAITREAVRYPMLDLEVRHGLDERSDLGVRVTSGSGVLVSYKRLLAGGAPDEAALAVATGFGFVNLGNHAYADVALLVTGRETGMVTPYGGVRAAHVLPTASGAVSDTPTAGGFAGVRLGTMDFGVSPEIGVYYDESALGLRRSPLLVVPTITLHGRDLLRLLMAF